MVSEPLRILGLVPARGGSRGVPGKNIRPIQGRSLVERTADVAEDSGVLDRIVLSTDSAEIADHGRAAGLEVPALRPAELATDDAPMLDVVLHTLGYLAEFDGYQPDAVALLQPTSPLRTADDIRRAVRMLGENDSVCSVVALPKDQCPHFLMRVRDDGYLDHFMPDGGHFTRRQDVPQAYQRNGTIYLTRAVVLMEQRSIYGARCVPMVMDSDRSLSIDDPEDWDRAARLLTGA